MTSWAVFLLVFWVSPCYPQDIPPRDDVARVARFVANQCGWASMATISSRDPVKGQPFSNTFSVSDGPLGSGTGVPYMYLTRLEISVQDLQVNSQASLSMSLAQTDFCRKHAYDPQSPLCAHVIFSGSVVEVNDTEATVAKNALFLRHPEMADWPSDHDWFFAKMNITQVWVLDYFGGVKTVTPEDYYNAKPYKLHLEFHGL
ncbi:protein CREG1 [Brienomyrus brachyistius]|uniref:protein CREG1 n=1 Tax=Brienomyrus brachyistius TaxID=42636 RepID=UPI0020B32457|nr:protein CREG1 [Brienomyrus brachyistius]